jgi:hypothetical protein
MDAAHNDIPDVRQSNPLFAGPGDIFNDPRTSSTGFYIDCVGSAVGKPGFFNAHIPDAAGGLTADPNAVVDSASILAASKIGAAPGSAAPDLIELVPEFCTLNQN